MRHREWLLATALASAVLVSGATPVAAVATFGAAVTVPGAGARCTAASIAPHERDGASGWASCDRVDASGLARRDGVAFLQQRAGRWSTTVLEGVQGRVLDAGHDGTGTYLLLASTGGRFGLGPAIVKRSPSGSLSGRQVGPVRGQVGSGSLVVKDGRWWAVFNVAGTGRDADRSFNLFEAGTLLGSTSSRQVTDTTDSDFSPSLVLRPQGGLVLLWQRSTLQGDTAPTAVRVAVTTGRGWVSRQLAALPGETSTSSASDGRHVFVSWFEEGQPVVGSDESGTLRTRRFVTRACARSGHLAASEGAVHLLFAQCLDEDGGYAVTALERRSGRWTSARLHAHRDRQVFVSGVESRSGRATAVFHDPAGVTSYTRHQ